MIESRRVRTLLDIMNYFNAQAISDQLMQLATFLVTNENLRRSAPNSQKGSEPFIALVKTCKEACQDNEFMEAVRTMETVERTIGDGRNENPASLYAHTWHMLTQMLGEITARKFLYVAPDRAIYLDCFDSVFSAKVRTAFPSAVPDMREAGNCLGAECNTAAVFHLMRTVEWGLRALCCHFDFRKAKSRNKAGNTKYTPISHVEWEIMLNQLQPRVDAKLSKVKRGPEKQRFQQYYYPILQDLRAIRDAWRNHVLHARSEYKREEAIIVFNHVKRIMEALAQKVSES